LDGHPAEAETAFRAGLVLFERKGDLVSAERTRMRLEKVCSASDTTRLEVEDERWTIRPGAPAAEARPRPCEGAVQPTGPCRERRKGPVPDRARRGRGCCDRRR